MIEALDTALGLHLDHWMSPQHCKPCTWFRMYVLFFSTGIAVTYFIFARQMWIARRLLYRLLKTPIGQSLCFVFILCGTAHQAHGLSMVNQYVALVLILLPVLFGYHLWLLYNGNKIVNNLKGLKNDEEIRVMMMDVRKTTIERVEAKYTLLRKELDELSDDA